MKESRPFVPLLPYVCQIRDRTRGYDVVSLLFHYESELFLSIRSYAIPRQGTLRGRHGQKKRLKSRAGHDRDVSSFSLSFSLPPFLTLSLSSFIASTLYGSCTARN